MSNGIESPLKKTWIRLLKNKPAIFSLIVIVFAVILAFIGPSVAPDKTPDADDQVLELANASPGFTVKMLLVKKNREEKDPNIISKILFGKNNSYQMVPINSYQFDDSANVVVQAYKGEGRKAEQMIFPVVDVVESLSIISPKIEIHGDKAVYTTFEEKQKTVSIAALKKDIAENNIITKKYRLGTDNYGRDILSRLLFGVRVSLSVGLVAVFISLTIGIFMGSVAGFYRGSVDNIIMWFINVV